MFNEKQKYLIKMLGGGVLLICFFSIFAPKIGLSYPGVDYDVQVTEKVMALTFDDGPYLECTPKILDELDKYHAKATFFMIGERMEKYPELVREVAKRGHVVANHSYSHPDNLKTLSNSQVEDQLYRTENIILNLTGESFYLFRPPRGVLDERLIKTIKGKNYKIVLWSISADHHDAPTPEKMAERVIKHAHPGEIVLLHDGRV